MVQNSGRLWAPGVLILTLLAFVPGCASAPLYSESGLHRGAVTLGEIPRDARGEPVWAAIRPTPGAIADPIMPPPAAAVPGMAAPVEQGDDGDLPTPPKA